jgi:hypothetical protein
VGVGQDGDDDHALAAMAEPEVGGTQPGCLHLVTGVLQSPASDVQAPPKESRHVLADDSDRADRLDDVEHAEPEPGSGPFDAESGGVGNAGVLAREAAADDIHGRQICRGEGERRDIVVPRDVGPVLGEHSAPPRINLALPGRAEPGELQPEVHSADA